MSAETETATATSESGGLNRGESVYSKEYRRLRKLTSTIEIQRQCVSEGGIAGVKEHSLMRKTDRRLFDLGESFHVPPVDPLRMHFLLVE